MEVTISVSIRPCALVDQPIAVESLAALRSYIMFRRYVNIALVSWPPRLIEVFCALAMGKPKLINYNGLGSDTLWKAYALECAALQCVLLLP